LGNAETAEFLLQQGEPPLDELKQILADIRRDDLRASEVIKRVRALVGKRKFRMQPQPLNEALADVSRLIAPDAERRGVAITNGFASDLPLVSCDRAQIEQVVLNLLLNAMDAVAGVPAGQRLIVLRSAQRDAEWLEASVEDNGHGIPPEKLDRIFDSFFTTKSQGMGLGLALARSIAESHGGRLTAENRPAGGAVFRLLLPIHSALPVP
jgi:signal transduction histidine kinase